MNITHNLPALLFLMLTSQVWCMDQQRYQLGSGSKPGSPSLRASTSLKEMLAPRYVEHPLLTKDKREKNLSLIKSIGAADARKKLLAAAASVCILNVAKELIAFGFWGSETLKPLTHLIPSNHLVPVEPCKPVCYMSGCCGRDCPDFIECGPLVCTNQTTCNTEPPSISTSLALPTAIISSFNVTTILLSAIALLVNNHSKIQSEEELQQVLQKLCTSNTLVKAQDIEARVSESEDTPLIATDAVLSEEQQKNLELIRSLGYHSTATKMWAFLALIFGANAVKDTLTLQLLGFDTPTLEGRFHNSTTTSGTLNDLGKTCIGTMIANSTGMVLSCVGALRAATKASQEKCQIKKLLKKLDQLTTNAEPAE